MDQPTITTPAAADPGDEHHDPTPAATPPATERVLAAIASVLGTTMYLVAPPACTWNLQPLQPVEIPISPDAMRGLLAAALVTVGRLHGIGDRALLEAVAYTQSELAGTPIELLRAALHTGMHVTVQHGLREIAQAQVADMLTAAAAATRDPSKEN